MVNRNGTRTKTVYIRRAGMTNSQPTRLSRRNFHRESAGTTWRLSSVVVDTTVDLEGTGIDT
jgi:hypothetical protein